MYTPKIMLIPDYIEEIDKMKTQYFYNCYDEREPLTFKGFIENIKYAKFKIGVSNDY